MLIGNLWGWGNCANGVLGNGRKVGNLWVPTLIVTGTVIWRNLVTHRTHVLALGQGQAAAPEGKHRHPLLLHALLFHIDRFRCFSRVHTFTRSNFAMPIVDRLGWSTEAENVDPDAKKKTKPTEQPQEQAPDGALQEGGEAPAAEDGNQ